MADLFRTLGRNTDGERVLRDALLLSPADAAIHYSLGLALIRLTRREEALIELQQAAESAPDRARYAYVYAVGLRSLGRRDEALNTLRVNAVRHPRDRDTLSALIEITSQTGDFKSALGYAEQLSGVGAEDARTLRSYRRVETKGRRFGQQISNAFIFALTSPSAAEVAVFNPLSRSKNKLSRRYCLCSTR